MELRKLGGLFLAVWLSQTCASDQRLLDFLSGLDICSKNQKLTPEQAVQAKIVQGKWGHLVIYPEIAVSSASATSH